MWNLEFLYKTFDEEADTYVECDPFTQVEASVDVYFYHDISKPNTLVIEILNLDSKV